jgi:hypothetical protein
MLLLFFAVVIFLPVASCLDDRFSGRIRIYPSVMMPLAHGKLTLGNLLLTEGSGFSRDPDNTIRLVLRADSIISVSIDEILDLPLPDTISRSFNTGQVRLEDFSTTSLISLYEIAGRIDEPEGSFILGSAGNMVLFPEVPPQDIGDFPAEKIGRLDYAWFSSGKMELTVRNNLPVPVSMQVRLLNVFSRSEVASFDFRDIEPGAAATLVSGLEGRLVRQSVTSEITFFSTGASSKEVYIDTGQSIELDFTASELSAIRGRALLEKTLLDQGSDAMVLHFANDVELQELIMKSGILNYRVDNGSGGMNLEVVFNSISKDGEKCRFTILPDGKGGYLTGDHTLSDVDFDLGEGVRIFMEYSLFAGSDNNEMTEFDLSGESFEFDLWFSHFQIGYAGGYFGSGELRPGLDYIDFHIDFFRNITGDLLLSDPSLKLFYENSGGVPSELLLNMSAATDDGTRQVRLFNEDRRVFPIIHPEESYTSVYDEIIINGESSNLVELLRLTPPSVKVDASVLMNPRGRAGGTDNFMTSDSRAYMGMEFEFPLDLQFTDLILTDTVASGIDHDDFNMIGEVFLNLQITNSLPGSASIKLDLYDSLTGQVLHTFDEILMLESAAVDAGGGVIEGTAVRTETEIEIPDEVLDKLRHSSHFIISVRLNSGKYQTAQVPVRFRTVDKLDFRIRMRAGLIVNN